MQFDVSVKSLQSAVSVVRGVIPRNSPKPILQHALVRASSSGVTIAGTDAEVGVCKEIADYTVKERGAELLPPKALEVIGSLPGETVTLAWKNGKVTIRTASLYREFGAESTQDYPAPPAWEAKDYYTIPGLQLGLRRTLFAADEESTRYALGGVLFDLKNEVLVATDTRRLAIAKCPVNKVGEPECPAQPVLPAKACLLVSRFDGMCDVTINSHAALVRCGDTVLWTRLVEGRFPRYQEVVPKGSEGAATLIVGPALGATRRAVLMATEESRGVVFEFADGLLKLSQANDVGKGDEELPCEVDGSITCELDPRYLADALKALKPEDAIKVSWTNAESALLLTADDGAYRYVLMPLARDK